MIGDFGVLNGLFGFSKGVLGFFNEFIGIEIIAKCS